MSVLEALQRRAQAQPARLALIAGERRVTYAQLWQRIMAAAHELAARGVAPGDRVALAAPATPAFAYGYFGAHLIGAVTVPFSAALPAPARDELIRRSGARVAFGAQHGMQELEELPLREAPLRPPRPSSPADLLFTTGTTGRPKCVRLTHGNIAAAVSHINAVIGVRESDVEVMPLPLCHSFGLGRLRCALAAGATLVLLDGFKLPGEIFAALERHRATGLAAVPAGLAVLLRLGARGLAPFAGQLRYLEIGSSPMRLEHKQALMELLPSTQIWMHYGMTEASRSAFLEFHRHRGRLDTVGTAAPGVRLSVRSGVLWIGGAHVSPGYWDDPQLQEESFAHGWVRTGDLAEVADDGFVRLLGRQDDMIDVGGHNVSPEEVEKMLVEHPAVREAACVGVADPRGIAGQVVRAYLVPAGDRPAEEELSGWLAARLEAYKLPAQYRWVEALPRTPSGKLSRRSLREAADG